MSIAELIAEPTELSVDRLESQLKKHASLIAATLGRWLLLVAEYDKRHAYERWEARTCAQWLSWHCNVSPTTAREYVRVARRLVELPIVREHFASGALTYSKVRAVTRVATRATDGELVELAKELSAAQLERTVRTLERALAERSDEELRAVEVRRGADHWRDPSGLNTLIIRVWDEEMAEVWAAIEHARDRDFATARTELGDKAEKVPARRGAGLPLVDAVLTAFDLSLSAAANADAELPERHQVIVHYEGEPTVDADGYITLGNGIRLHPKVARQMGCDAAVQVVVSDGCGGMRMGRKVRTFTRNQRRAIARRYPTCAFPGCEVPAPRSQFHHVVGWEEGGLTDVENGLPLCRAHHRAVHQGGWRLFKDAEDRVVVVSPDGRRRMTGSPPMTTVTERDFRELDDSDDRLVVARPTCERGNLAFALDVLLGNAALRGDQYWDRRRARAVSLN